MSILYIGIGLASGVALTYFLNSKNTNNDKNTASSEQINFLTQQNSKLKDELTEVTNDLEKAKTDNKNLRSQRDKFEDKSDDFDIELTKLKRTNSNLAQEVEKLKSELNEYEMLYNARKQEIADLKKQLENGK